MKNSAGRGGCYPPRPSTLVDNILRDLENSSYSTKAEFNNCFIIPFTIFSSLKLLNLLAAFFLLNKNNTISSPAFFAQRFNNLQRAALLVASFAAVFRLVPATRRDEPKNGCEGSYTFGVIDSI